MKRARSPSPEPPRVTVLDEFWSTMLRPHLDPRTRASVRCVTRRLWASDPDYVLPGWMWELLAHFSWAESFWEGWNELLSFPRRQRDRLGAPTVTYLGVGPRSDIKTPHLMLGWFFWDYAVTLTISSGAGWHYTHSPWDTDARSLLRIMLDPLAGETEEEHKARFHRACPPVGIHV